MDVAYLPLVAFLVLLIISNFAVIRRVYSWITWCSNIIRLHALPSPPRRWLLGHALEVSVLVHTIYVCVEYRVEYFNGPLFFPLSDSIAGPRLD